MKSNEEIDREIAFAIHYPECWDTIAYPTLASALFENLELKDKCQTCEKNQGIKSLN